MGIAGHRMITRQRWTPSHVQLEILERIFDEGKGTPTKKKIRHITAELSQHGDISETNVYNWFQNRRARTKRKQLGLTNYVEPEIDNCRDYVKGKKVKFDDSDDQENLGTRQGNIDCQSHKRVPEQFNSDFQQHRSMDSFSSKVNSKALIDFSRSASFKQGNERCIAPNEPAENGSSSHAGEDYHMLG